MDSKCGPGLDASLGLGSSMKKTNRSVAESITDVVVHVEDTAQGTTDSESLNTLTKGIGENGFCFVSENETLAGTSMEYTTFLEFLRKSSSMSKNGRENYKQFHQVQYEKMKKIVKDVKSLEPIIQEDCSLNLTFNRSEKMNFDLYYKYTINKNELKHNKTYYKLRSNEI